MPLGVSFHGESTIAKIQRNFCEDLKLDQQVPNRFINLRMNMIHIYIYNHYISGSFGSFVEEGSS